MRKFEELPIFKQSHNLVIKLYKFTETFPDSEKYGLTSQIRRSAVSVPANIVEGLHRNTTKELIAFMYNARGSAGELLYHLLLSKDLNYLEKEVYLELDEITQEILKQLNGRIRSEKRKLNIIS